MTTARFALLSHVQFLTPLTRSIYFPDGSTLWASQWNRLTDRHRVFCVPVGSISLRIPTLGVAFDGAVKLVHGGGIAFSGSGHLVYATAPFIHYVFVTFGQVRRRRLLHGRVFVRKEARLGRDPAR